jgi:hypothetical protein
MPAQLLITREDNGQIRVEGPINDKMFAYALLEAARDAIYDFHKQNENRIQPASFVPPVLGPKQ